MVTEIRNPEGHCPVGGNAIEHSARRERTAYPGASYILPSDATEKQRKDWMHLLELQHSLYKVVFDGKLVLAPVSFEKGDRVLDCGTGTGIWLLQLAEDVSNDVVLHGIDIEGRLFPEGVLHPNLNFSIQSTLSLPDEWANTYKFVHQRLFIAALKKQQWEFELGELFKIIAPGGWVQLCEPGTRHCGEITERVTRMINALYASRDIFVDVWEHMPKLLEKVGFVNIVTEERKVPMGKWEGALGEGIRNNYVTLFRALKTPILDGGGFGVVESENEFDELMTTFSDELDATQGAYARWFVFYAQKP